MARRPRVPEPVCEEADEVREEHEYSSLGEALRHMVREAGYEV